MGPSGLVAVLAGLDHHRGRPPALHRLRAAAHRDVAVARCRAGGGASLLAFIVVYFLVFGAGTFYLLRLMSKAPGAMTIRWKDQEGPLRGPPVSPGGDETSARSPGLTHGTSISLSSGPASSPSPSFVYVVLDGFDLGIGMLFPLARKRDRD
jgi:cytochrome d ubiquinol oxidase subunit I